MKKRGYFKRFFGAALALMMLMTEPALVYAEELPVDAVQEEQTAEEQINGLQEEELQAEEEQKAEEQQAVEAKDEGESGRAAAQEREASPEELGYMPGEILVTYKEDVSEAEVEQAVQEKDGELVETLAELDEETVALVSISEDSTVEAAVEEYLQDPAIETAEPNYIVESFEDEIEAAAESTSQQWYLDYVGAAAAWNVAAQHSNNKIRVAVIDTGAKIDHEDLSGVVNRELSVEIVKTTDGTQYSYSTVNLRGDGFLNGTEEQNTSTTHGTHVAGIIAAQSDNNVGIQGVASGGSTAIKNSIADLVVIDAFTAKTEKGVDSGTVADILYAMQYAQEQQCRVINLSLGTKSNSTLLESTCQSMKEAGITIVCAAGNDSTDAGVYPSDYASTISVINIGQTGEKSSTSNYGSAKDLSAPGTGIYSTTSASVSSYGNMSGTSMASPIVTATVAMMLYVNPNLTPDQIRQILCDTAKDLNTEGKDIYTGYGSVDAAAAVTRALNLDLKDAEVSSIADYNANGKAITPEPEVKLYGQTLKKDTDYTLSYSDNIEPGTATVTITGTGAYKGTKQVTFTIKDITGISYRTHVQTYGWETKWSSNGAASGTTGQAKRLEAIEIQLTNQAYTGSVQYRTHVQTYGWETNWSSNGAASGTTGQAKRLEAIEIQLTGEMAAHYDIYYRVHAQTYGWLGWAKNGAPAGTAGYSKRLEAIEICLVPKGGNAPGSTEEVYIHPLVQYETHVQTYGWQSKKYDGQMSGTTGESKRLEGIKIALVEQDYSGDIQYRTHVQTYGWETKWASNGEVSGTTGQSKRLEAIEIKLTGEMANHYDIYYRVHAQTYGWLDWAKNGESAGTAGLSKRLECIEICLVPKGGSAPGSTAQPFIDITDRNSQVVVLDPGHQRYANKDVEPLGPGSTTMKMKVSGGTQGRITKIPEYEVVLDVSLLLKNELESRGYQVYMTRTSHDVDISNKARAEFANTLQADAFVRIHCNGSTDTSVYGAETLCMTADSPYNSYLYRDSRALSDKVLSGLCNATGAKQRPVWETNTMTGINWCKVPVTIVEMGYMTNAAEERKLVDANYQKLLAKGIADGITAYLDTKL